MNDTVNKIVVFHLINQENKGLSGARNRGMSESKGEFITFVDSDDVIKDDMLEQLLKHMTSEEMDIVECWYTNDKKRNRNPFSRECQNYFSRKCPRSFSLFMLKIILSV